MTTLDAFILPGRSKTWLDGIGQQIINKGYTASGVDIDDSLLKHRFSDQLDLVRQKLERVWSDTPLLLGKSYGAYLLLHTLADMEPYSGNVLLFSPVIGATSMKGGLMMYRPPKAARLLEMAENGTYPAPAQLEIHTGADDPVCDPELVLRFGEGCGGDVHVIPKAGHSLPPDYQNGVWAALIY